MIEQSNIFGCWKEHGKDNNHMDTYQVAILLGLVVFRVHDHSFPYVPHAGLKSFEAGEMVRAYFH